MENSKNNTEQWYMASYDHFLNYFKKDDPLNKQDIILGISMAYSWMPTIPKSIKITDDDVETINALKKEVDKRKNLEKLTKKINNSIIGTSKLLHFICPDTYPIWDKNVCKAYFKEKQLKQTFSIYQVRKIDNYLSYIDYCHDIIKNILKFHQWKRELEERYGFDMIMKSSDLRIIDLYMWNKGQIYKQNKATVHYRS